MTWDPRAEHSAEEWARMSAERANIAANHALAAHQEIGNLARAVLRIETALTSYRQEVAEIVKDLHSLSRRTQKSLHELQEQVEEQIEYDPADNTQIRELKTRLRTAKEEIRATDRNRRQVKNIAIGLGVATASTILAAILMRFLHL